MLCNVLESLLLERNWLKRKATTAINQTPSAKQGQAEDIAHQGSLGHTARLSCPSPRVFSKCLCSGSHDAVVISVLQKYTVSTVSQHDTAVAKV